MLLQALYKATKSKWGFTLAELLISLAILGVIATFAIPKILSSQQNTQYNAASRQVIAMLSEAHQKYMQMGGSTLTMRTTDIVPYINYVKADHTAPGCPYQCYRLHDGGVLIFWLDGLCPDVNSALPFFYKPDGDLLGSTVPAIGIYLYNNGRIRTGSTMEPATKWSIGGGGTCTLTRDPYADPDWFHL